MAMLHKLLATISFSSDDQRRAEVYRNIIRNEAKVGGKLFGAIRPGNRREFFCLDERTWVWHEEWTDQEGRHVITTRYDVRPNGVLKAQDNQPYQYINVDEAQRLFHAVQMYNQHIDSELYGLTPVAA